MCPPSSYARHTKIKIQKYPSPILVFTFPHIFYILAYVILIKATTTNEHPHRNNKNSSMAWNNDVGVGEITRSYTTYYITFVPEVAALAVANAIPINKQLVAKIQYYWSFLTSSPTIFSASSMKILYNTFHIKYFVSLLPLNVNNSGRSRDKWAATNSHICIYDVLHANIIHLFIHSIPFLLLYCVAEICIGNYGLSTKYYMSHSFIDICFQAIFIPLPFGSVTYPSNLARKNSTLAIAYSRTHNFVLLSSNCIFLPTNLSSAMRNENQVYANKKMKKPSHINIECVRVNVHCIDLDQLAYSRATQISNINPSFLILRAQKMWSEKKK